MTTRLADLPKRLKSTEVFFIGSGTAGELQSLKPALIDGSKNSTGQDMALLFSSSDKAFTYRNRFPSLSDLDVFQATVNEMIEIFDGKVMYFVVDPGEHMPNLIEMNWHPAHANPLDYIEIYGRYKDVTLLTHSGQPVNISQAGNDFVVTIGGERIVTGSNARTCYLLNCRLVGRVE